jgi:hypothetical protein
MPPFSCNQNLHPEPPFSSRNKFDSVVLCFNGTALTNIPNRLDPSSGHCTQCVLEWESLEAFQTAAKEDEAQIMGDVKNYTEGKPTFIVGKVVGSG